MRLHINIGSKNKLDPTRLIGLINEGLDSGNAEVGKIEIMKKFSFFEIEEKAGVKLMEALKGQAHEGVALEVQPSEAKPSGASKGKSSFKDNKKKDFRSKPWNKRDSGGGGRKGRRKKY